MTIRKAQRPFLDVHVDSLDLVDYAFCPEKLDAGVEQLIGEHLLICKSCRAEYGVLRSDSEEHRWSLVRGRGIAAAVAAALLLLFGASILPVPSRDLAPSVGTGAYDNSTIFAEGFEDGTLGAWVSGETEDLGPSTGSEYSTKILPRNV